MSGDYKLCGGSLPNYDTDTWCTPSWFYDNLNREFDFKLDAACTSNNCLCPSGLMIDFGIDALRANWKRHLDRASDWIWLNPPFRTVRFWVRKALESNCNVFCLVQADTGTRWWHRYAVQAYEIRFYEGRMRYEPPEGRRVGHKGSASATKPSAGLVFCPAKRRFKDEPITVYISKSESVQS